MLKHLHLVSSVTTGPSYTRQLSCSYIRDYIIELWTQVKQHYGIRASMFHGDGLTLLTCCNLSDLPGILM